MVPAPAPAIQCAPPIPWYPREGFLIAFSLLAGIQLYFSSFPGGSLLQVFVGLAWLALVGFLTLAFISYLVQTQPGPWRQAWRWPAIAAATGALAALCLLDVPMRFAFEYSRPGLEQAVRVGPAADYTFAGLYVIEEIRPRGSSKDLVVASAGACCVFADYGGFTYSPTGEPSGDCDGERQEFKHIDGPWYSFVCYW